MYQQCLEMEEGLSITFHYVDQHVSQREIYRSGKNTSKCSDKEFAITGRTQRQKNLLQLNQVGFHDRLKLLLDLCLFQII